MEHYIQKSWARGSVIVWRLPSGRDGCPIVRAHMMGTILPSRPTAFTLASIFTSEYHGVMSGSVTAIRAGVIAWPVTHLFVPPLTAIG